MVICFTFFVICTQDKLSEHTKKSDLKNARTGWFSPVLKTIIVATLKRRVCLSNYDIVHRNLNKISLSEFKAFPKFT